ncbi:META domain-containing protein [Isoptericola aurantiacus]|uniref:META domain-containing protein n=1 Tax=Isoptericola aurantiacus TaxID=3377839 RepID=UPI00383BBB3E
MTVARTPHRTLLLLVALAALAACSPSGTDVAGKTFVSTDVTGHELAEGSQIVVAFTEDAVGARPGCNSMSAPATWDDGTLQLTAALSSTKMACPDALLDQDAWFGDLLGAGPTLELDGQTLTITGPEATVVLDEEAEAS